MELLAAVLPRVRRLVPSAERGVTAAVVGFLVALEILGRKATSELHDALAGTALLAVALFVVSWHRSQPLGWVDRVMTAAGRLLARFDRLRYDIGIDFRGSPPLPHRLPRAVPVLFAALAGWAVLALAAWQAYPDGWRAVGVGTSYVLYLVVLILVWAALGGCVLAGVYLPVSALDQRMRSAAGESDPRGADAVVLVGYGVLAVLVAWVTPPVYGVGLCLAAAAGGLLLAAASPGDEAAILWRAGAGSPVFRVPLRRILAIAAAAAAVFVFALLLTACGGRLIDPPALDAPMPVTGFLGAVTAWLVPGLLALAGYQAWQFHRTDPSRRQPAVVRVDGPAPPADLARAAGRLLAWGFRPRLNPRPPARLPAAAPDDRAEPPVAVRLVPADQSEATEFDPRWPLKVSVEDFANESLRDRLARRDEIQVRRRFFRGLSALLKQAAAAVPSAGGGYWLAPHWWFLGSLLWEEPDRDRGTDADPLRPVGPAYRRAFAPRVRQHAHAMLRALEVDLIYVEHGVGHRKLEKVLRAAAELYDVHGGRRRAEEHHFRGVPKVRVMIHEYAPGNPFRSDAYPEPKFDDVSRFRVLHVFKDRGGEEERVEPPFDFSWEPSPLSIG